MKGGEHSLPSGMRSFNELSLARPFLFRFITASAAVLFLLAGFAWVLYSATENTIVSAVPLMLVPALLWWFYHSSSMLHVPLAVDMNHPFMVEDDPIGKSNVMVRLSDGRWVDLGHGRVRLAQDDLLGGCNLVRDNEDYTFLGHFSNRDSANRGLRKQVVLLNQALALRDAVNGEEDTIEQAREREGMDTGLLDRSWMEEQESIDVEPEGLMSKLRGE
tara:strand:+ start:5111 stop:5764 length:654 start_codon:yes stop_codon:yes gene_type:complete